jgi:hypothetical protein
VAVINRCRWDCGSVMVVLKNGDVLITAAFVVLGKMRIDHKINSNCFHNLQYKGPIGPITNNGIPLN